MSTVYTVYRIEPLSGAIDTRPYIGVTGDYRMRIHKHRHDYKRFPNPPVYASMRANKGFENYRPLIVQQFSESDYEEGVAMRLAADLEARLVRELIPLKGCLNTEIPGRTASDWRAEKRLLILRGFVLLIRFILLHGEPKRLLLIPVSELPRVVTVQLTVLQSLLLIQRVSVLPIGFILLLGVLKEKPLSLPHLVLLNH
jgi:hypothetical protein